MNATALHDYLKSNLGEKFAPYQAPAPEELIKFQVLEELTGGLPRGGLTEIYGPESSGRTALLLSILAEAAASGELCALLDGQDALDPRSAAAAGVNLSRLLWVRCHLLEQAVRSAELLLEGGGFGLLAIDCAGFSAELMKRIPLTAWFRLQKMAKNARAALIVIEREPTAGSSASLAVHLTPEAIEWSNSPAADWLKNGSCSPSHACLLSNFKSNAEARRSRRIHHQGVRSILKVRAAWG